MKRTKIRNCFLVLSMMVCALNAFAYPIDGYQYTLIRRLVNEYLNHTDTLRNSRLKPGATKYLAEVNLNLVNSSEQRSMAFPEADPSFQKQISALFRTLEKDYSIAVMDMTEGRPLRYAEHRPTAGYQPGSVGKLAVLLGFFTELNNLYGNDWESKRALMTSKFVWCEKWGIPNSHTVPFYDIEKDKLVKRYVQEKDNFSLYEWLDHMLSVSSNAAASIVWREALYMRIMGDKYECAGSDEVKSKMATFSKDSISTLAMEIVNEPLRAIGIDKDEWRLGSFFTNGADQYVRPKGGSIGTPRGLMKFLYKLEQGQLVDIRSSLEMKNLIYITDRRIRYAAAPALNHAMVYFKSGSLYKCKKDGSPCGKYKGNVNNYMNSIAIVEHDDCTTYMVALMSNVLYKNSAAEHQGLASQIDRLVKS